MFRPPSPPVLNGRSLFKVFCLIIRTFKEYDEAYYFSPNSAHTLTHQIWAHSP